MTFDLRIFIRFSDSTLIIQLLIRLPNPLCMVWYTCTIISTNSRWLAYLCCNWIPQQSLNLVILKKTESTCKRVRVSFKITNPPNPTPPKNQKRIKWTKNRSIDKQISYYSYTGYLILILRHIYQFSQQRNSIWKNEQIKIVLILQTSRILMCFYKTENFSYRQSY